VQFEARCRNLGEGNLCAVYFNRPHICRAYDDRSCEVNAPQPGLVEFKEPKEFLEYLSRKKPKVYKTIAKKHVPAGLQPGPPVVGGRPIARKRA
jgi:Fe-S-cluster containining protein